MGYQPYVFFVGAQEGLPFMSFVDSCGFSLSVAQAINQAIDYRNNEQG